MQLEAESKQQLIRAEQEEKEHQNTMALRLNLLENNLARTRSRMQQARQEIALKAEETKKRNLEARLREEEGKRVVEEERRGVGRMHLEGERKQQLARLE